MNSSDLIVLLIVYGGIQALFPNSGPLGWFRKFTASQQREKTEAALKHLHDCQWRGSQASLESLSGYLALSSRATLALAGQLESQGLIKASQDGLVLSNKGEELAVQVIRAHRLWERYLADEAGMGIGEVHSAATHFDRDRSSESLADIEATLGYPSVDPHGEPIPSEDGVISPPSGEPLSNWSTEQQGIIVRVEDEPEAVLAQIVAQGLVPGTYFRVLKKDNKQIVLWDGRDTHRLAPIVAANIFVEELKEQRMPERVFSLEQLELGERAMVYDLSNRIHGFSRRRLLDLGLTEGSEIQCELRSIFGDPTAYRIRGSLVALRRDEAKHVFVERDERGEK